jgi:hypothetical protein
VGGVGECGLEGVGVAGLELSSSTNSSSNDLRSGGVEGLAENGGVGGLCVCVCVCVY